MRRAAIVVVTLGLTVACGSEPATLRGPQPTASPSVTPTSSPTPTATASPTPASASPSLSTSPAPRPHHRALPPVELNEASSGRTLRVRVGQRVVVELPGGSVGGYVVPRSSDEQVVPRRSSSGGYPSDAPARASFEAAQRGEADLSATTDFGCLHTQPRCLPAQKQWLVHLVVG